MDITYRDIFNKNFPNKKKFNDDNTPVGIEGFKGYDSINDILYIYFEPTNCKQDWKTNFNFFKKNVKNVFPIKGGYYHRGFLNRFLAYQSLDIMKDAGRLNKIIISGFSYGSAVAVLYALKFSIKYNINNIQVILFGCPRVGNKAFNKFYNSKIHSTINIVNGSDIVTKIPFKWLGFLQFITFGKLFMFSQRMGNVIINIKRSKFKLFSFKDHQPNSYLESLEKIDVIY